jgi:hypothetical protein
MPPPSKKGIAYNEAPISAVAMGGLMDCAAVLAVFVIAAEPVRSSGLMMAFMYDWRVGTSICEMDWRKKRNITVKDKSMERGTQIKKILENK